MARDALTGIVLDSDCIHWCVLQHARDGWHADAGGVTSPPDNAVSGEDAPDVPAEAQPPAVTESGDARELQLAQIGGALRGTVVLGVPTDQVLLRVVRLPTDDAEEIAGMVELQGDKFTPFPLETMALSHEVLHQTDGESVVLVAAVRLDVLESARSLLATARAVPERVDVVALAWWEALQTGGHVAEGEDRAFVVVDDGHMELILCVFI